MPILELGILKNKKRPHAIWADWKWLQIGLYFHTWHWTLKYVLAVQITNVGIYQLIKIVILNSFAVSFVSFRLLNIGIALLWKSLYSLSPIHLPHHHLVGSITNRFKVIINKNKLQCDSKWGLGVGVCSVLGNRSWSPAWFIFQSYYLHSILISASLLKLQRDLHCGAK